MSSSASEIANLVVKQQVTNELLYQLLRAVNEHGSTFGNVVGSRIMAELNEAVHG